MGKKQRATENPTYSLKNDESVQQGKRGTKQLE